MANEDQKLNSYKVAQPLLYALVMMMGMFLGFKVYQTTYGSGHQSSAVEIRNSRGLNQINDVLQFVDQHYVDSIDNDSFVNDAITEILENLDPHSSYIPPTDMKQVAESMQGNFVDLQNLWEFRPAIRSLKSKTVLLQE